MEMCDRIALPSEPSPAMNSLLVSERNPGAGRMEPTTPTDTPNRNNWQNYHIPENPRAIADAIVNFGHRNCQMLRHTSASGESRNSVQSLTDPCGESVKTLPSVAFTVESFLAFLAPFLGPFCPPPLMERDGGKRQ